MTSRTSGIININTNNEDIVNISTNILSNLSNVDDNDDWDVVESTDSSLSSLSSSSWIIFRFQNIWSNRCYNSKFIPRWSLIIILLTIIAIIFELNFISRICFNLLQLILLLRIFSNVSNLQIFNYLNYFDYYYQYLRHSLILGTTWLIILHQFKQSSLTLSPLSSTTNYLIVNAAQFDIIDHPHHLIQKRQASSSAANYIEYNLADYCTEEKWSDYPGRHLIRLEKSLKIRLPSILDFQFNETHRNRFGFFRPGPYPIWNTGGIGDHSFNYTATSRPTFVPYCLLSFSVDYGHRIYAEGLATGLITEGKEWFTETLHFKTTNPANSKESPQLGTFTTSTEKNSLTLVFEQLHLGPFSFHLILTPFRDAKPEYVLGCESEHEYQCTNQRCIARYLTCDHHNNCGDYSDEHVNCLSRVPSSSPSPDSSRPDYDPSRPDYPISRPDDGRGIGGGGGKDWDNDRDWGGGHHTEVPTFPIDPDGWDPNGHPKEYDDDDNEIPEYIDVPLPTDGHHRRRPSFTRPKPQNGFHGAGTSGGGFLGDLFRFDSDTSNVVKVVRYILALLVIIILVTLVNFMIWCLITKRDQWFMATTTTDDSTISEQPQSRPVSSSPAQQSTGISIITV